jgi:hypothetical protein
LKHADDQTVVGLAAVLAAIDGHGLDPASFTDWGVIAAPRFLGRAALAVALGRFALEGAWGVSPHLIPHRSLHSISGTVSQALKIHGPNFGVGGGPDAAGELLVVAGSMVADDRLPGVWVVMTEYDPELAPADPAAAQAGPPAPPAPVAQAVALALVRDSTRAPHARLRISGRDKTAGGTAAWPMFSLQGLREALTGARPAQAACWRLRCGWAAMERAEAGAEN